MSLAHNFITDTARPEEDTDRQSGSDYSHSGNLAYLINEVYRSRIAQSVDFGVVISYMPFMSEILPQVYMLRRTSRDEAANIFFEHLKNIEEPGKYQSFVDALREARYPLLVAALESNEIISNDHEHNLLINIFFPEIAKTIDAEQMSQQLQMKEVITAEEGEQIRKTARHSDNASASFELLFKIPHRAVNWYETFLGLLWENGHHKLLEKIDTKFYEKQIEGKNKETNGDVVVEEENDPGCDSSEDLTVRAEAHPVLQRSSVSTTHHLVPQRLPTSPAAHPAAQRSSVSPSSPSVPQKETKLISSELGERVVSELSELKSFIHAQTQCLQTLLDKTELLTARVDRLDQKLESFLRSGS